MRVAVISDIHANLHALEAVLEAIDADPPDALWCLGDLVGYGPRPNEVRRARPGARRRSASSAITTSESSATIDLDEFSPDAAVSARWTQTVLLDEHRAYLESLSPAGEDRRCRALPREPERSDLGVRDHRGDCARSLSSRRSRRSSSSGTVTSRSRSRSMTGGSRATSRPAARRSGCRQGRWLLNPGSVGQPRDGDPRAAWLDARPPVRAGRVPARRRTTSRARRPRSGNESCPSRSPSDSRTAR